MIELTDFISFCCFAAGPAGLCPEDAWWGSFLLTQGRMRGGGASSSRGGGSPGSAARALAAMEEHLREALDDGLARVSFRLINLCLI